MPGLKRLFIAVALVAGACPILAQTDTPPKVDTIPTGRLVTLFLFDTVVVKHAVYQLDSSTVIRKEVAELKGEFYEAALKAVERENSGIGNVYYAITIMLAIILGIAGYTGYTANKARQALDRELGQIGQLRRQTEENAKRAVRDIKIECDDSIKEVGDIVEQAKSELEKILSSSARIGEVEKKLSSIIAIANDKAAALQDITMEQRLRLIDGADAKKAVKHYEALLAEMERDGIPLDKIPTSMHKNVGLSYYRLQRWGEAVQELEAYLHTEPTDSEALFTMAYALSKLERVEEACDYWDRTTQADPENATAFYNWGVALGKMCDATNETRWLELAFEKYERAVAIKQDHHKAFNNWGFALDSMYDATKETRWLELAFEKYERAVAIKKDKLEAFNNWGVALGKMYDATKKTKWLELAIEKYERAISIKKDKHEAYGGLSTVHLKMYSATGEAKWLESAMAISRRALAIAPDRKDHNYNLACCLALLGKRDEMLVSLREAIEFDSKYKKMARDDEDFKTYWDDPDFITLTKEG